MYRNNKKTPSFYFNSFASDPRVLYPLTRCSPSSCGVWKHHSAIVLPTLLYGAETWTSYRRHQKSLEAFHQRSLRRVLRIHWSARRANVSVLEQAEMKGIEAMLMKLQLHWAGHVLWMDDHRLPKQCLYGEIEDHKRSAGGQKKRFKNVIGSHLDNAGIKRKEWTILAADRPACRSAMHQGVQDDEKRRRNHSITKRQEKKARRDARTAGTAPPAPAGVVCPVCGFVATARIGLIGHLRSHLG